MFILALCWTPACGVEFLVRVTRRRVHLKKYVAMDVDRYAVCVISITWRAGPSRRLSFSIEANVGQIDKYNAATQLKLHCDTVPGLQRQAGPMQ